MIEEGAYQHVLPGEASVDERGDVPEDSSSASVGLFRGSEHVDELVHEGRHRPAAAPPRALGVSSARARRRGRHLGLFSHETPAPAGGPAGRAPTSPTLRATNRACARANDTLAFRAPDRWRLSTFRRRPRPPHPRILSQPRRQDPAVHRANGWSLSAPSPRAPAAKCPSFAGLPSPDSRVLSGKGHSASNRRSKRPSPLTTLPAASLHRILIAGRRSSVAILFVIWLANEYMSTCFQLRLIFLYVILFVLTCFSVK